MVTSIYKKGRLRTSVCWAIKMNKKNIFGLKALGEYTIISMCAGRISIGTDTLEVLGVEL